jgi:hypothetical protein
MAGLDTNKISNILGTKLPQWLIAQLTTRSQQGSKENRDNDNVLYLANKSAWIRLVSSIDIINDSDINYFKKIVGDNIKNPSDLAKEFVLFGGTSKYLGNNSYGQRAGLGKNGAYSPLGTEEIQDFGYRPMPGITSVNIETQGKLGSLRAATINFKCWDKSQLDIIDALYFKLGFTMFLEWGNTFFYPSKSNRIQSTELYSIDPFRQNLTKEEIAIQISTNIRESEGNYDALLGMVTNFNFSYNQDGGYDCTIKLMGLGVLGDSIKINNPKDLPNILAEEIRRYNNTLLQIAASQNIETPPAAPAAAAPQQESILKELNKEINNVDKEPTNQQKLVIAKTAGLPNSTQKLTGYYDNNIDYFYELKNRSWSWLIPRFGAIIPVNNTTDLVSSVNIDTTNLFNKLTNFFDSNKPPSNFQFGQTTNPSNPVSATTLLQNQAALFYSLPIETKMFKTSDVILTSRGTTVDIRATRFSYLGINGKKYPIGIKLEFQTINPSFPTDTVNSEEVYTKAINQIKTDGSFKVSNLTLGVSTLPYAEIGEIDSSVNNVNREGRLSFPILSLTKDVVVTVNDKIKQQVNRLSGSSVRDATGNVNVNVRISLYITDSNLIQSITKGSKAPDIKVVEATIAGQNQQQFNKEEDQTEGQDSSITQIKQALESQSGLELTLRTIQVHALNRAINRTTTPDLEIGRRVYTLNIWDNKDTTQGGIAFYKQIFSNGIFSNIIEKLIENSIVDQDPKSPQERFNIQSKYGFATELMAGRANFENLSGKRVDFKDLLNAYVVPYQINQEIIKGTSTNHPVYIPLGLLLMILNHSCTIYDTKDSSAQTPLVYIDFNPNLNFFLSNSKQLSTNPWVTLIPFEGGFKDYQKLFSDNLLTDKKTSISPLSGSREETPLFKIPNDDLLSPQIPKIKFDRDNNNVYRGKLMNILLNIDYLVKLVRDYSLKDGTNNIYLKPFLEQIISDVNKYLGNFNALRLSYNDGGNTFQIVDDQVMPPLQGETILSPDNIDTLPLVGKSSIAKNLEIKTEISNKLSNMIAISANADVANKATLSTNGDNFGFINTSYKDRYIPIKGDITGSFKTDLDAVKASAIQFNQTVSDFYSKINPSEANVSHATNYYIEKMSRVKNDEYPTRASTMIPVSVNFTTDGVSGFNMGQAFTIPQEVLPYTYNNRNLQGVRGLGSDHINKVGFVVVGLNNTIENNQWNTTVRANMIFLKKTTDFSGSVEQLAVSDRQFGDNPTNQNVSIPTQNTNFVGSNSQAKKVAEEYLGKQMTDQEWNQLVAATFAEASRNQQEEAWVMAVILNRTRTRYLGATTILDTLTRKNQFQAVTGTSANGNQPSTNYVNGPTTNQANSIYGAVINILPTVPKNYLFFTSNNVAAYGRGTNLAFLDNLKKQPGSKIIGQTIFSITA